MPYPGPKESLVQTELFFDAGESEIGRQIDDAY